MLSSEDVLHLFDLLPKSASKREANHLKSFAARAYVHGPDMGLRTETRRFPESCRILCRFVQQSKPEHAFSSVVILDGVQSPVHVDRNNQPQSQNLAIPISKFTNGHIWVEDGIGSHPMQHGDDILSGSLLPVADGPVLLSAAHQRHCVTPWQGRRVVLVAFTVRAWDDSSLRVLRDLGFRPEPLADRPSPCPKPVCPAVSPLFVEIFSGHGGLSAAAAKIGFSILAIDHSPRNPAVPTVKLDLTRSDNQQLLMEVLKGRKPDAISMGPPCGTASRSREKPLSQAAKGLGFKEPQPLRSGLHPLGLPHIDPKSRDGLKLQAANCLYRFVLVFCSFALKMRSLSRWKTQIPAGSGVSWPYLSVKLRLSSGLGLISSPGLCMTNANMEVRGPRRLASCAIPGLPFSLWQSAAVRIMSTCLGDCNGQPRGGSLPPILRQRIQALCVPRGQHALRPFFHPCKSPSLTPASQPSNL